ncbi:hypothetical protein [Chryseobacterium daeguense]|jgi:hypothetical protein|uniref:hypothetical protein n=1 Tax=Chryseobacterium daeguense TaxID=412438 RepID=UPI0012DE78D8|nr:hypothetical protein [Chryseobacterium daeguense]
MLKLNLTDNSKTIILIRMELLHGSGTDWAMLFGSILLLIKGASCRSLDKKLIPNGK